LNSSRPAASSPSGTAVDFGPMSGTSAIVEPATAEGPWVRYAARLQWLAVGLALAAIAQCVGITLISAAGDPRFPINLDLETIGFLGSVILFPAMGALIIQRRPLTRVAWLMIATGVGLGFGLLMFGYGTTGMPPAPPRPLALEALVLSQLFFIPSIAAGAVLLLLLFPTDRLLEPRWRIVVAITVAGVLLYDLGTLFHGGGMDQDRFPGLQNPLGAPAAWAPLVGLMAFLGNILVTIAALFGALSLVVGTVARISSRRPRSAGSRSLRPLRRLRSRSLHSRSSPRARSRLALVSCCCPACPSRSVSQSVVTTYLTSIG
jgi:hypothetical protein